MRLLDTLSELGDRLDSRLPYLNRGGCGVYARHVVAALQRLGVDAWARIVSGSRHDLDELRDSWGLVGRQCWRREGFYISHVIVEFVHEGRRYRHDSTATVEAYGERWTDGACPGDLMRGRITLADLEDMTASADGWNSEFGWYNCAAVEEDVAAYLSPNNARLAA